MSANYPFTMKPDQDKELDALLQEWQVHPVRTPGFNAEVWQRIAAEESAAGVGLGRGRINRFLTRVWETRAFNPAWGAAIVLLALGVGAGLGHRQVQELREEQWVELGQRYAHSINPLSLAQAHPGHGEYTASASTR